MTTHARSVRDWRWIALALLFVAIWFSLLEARPLTDPDEGRYAEIPREMVASGDWVTPRLNALLYFEKPPLQYWATATAYTVFGTSNWTARLWTALTGLAGVLLVLYAGARLHSFRAGAYAALMAASTLLYFALAHITTLDMGVTFFLALCIFAVAIALSPQASTRERRYWLWAAWAAAALAVLSKGLIGVLLPGATLVVYSAARRDVSVLLKAWSWPGLALFLAIAAPWFIAVQRANPGFAQFFFIHEHFARFLTTVHHRTQPWWFFIPILALGALPWTAPLFAGFWRACRTPRAPREFAPSLFLAIWCAVVFLFFSASGSKLIPYILPLFPALCVLAGEYICEAPPRRLALQIVVSSVVLAAIVAALPFVVHAKEGAAAVSRDDVAWFAAASAVWLVIAAVTWSLHARRPIEALLAATALGACIAHQLTFVGVERVTPGSSTFALAQALKPRLNEFARIYSVQTYPQSLPFYLGRTLMLVDYQGELEFGIEHEPGKQIATIATFSDIWRREANALAVMEIDTYEALRRAGLAMEPVASDRGGRIAVRLPAQR